MFESYYKEEREDRPWYPEREYSEDGGSVGRLEERFLTGRWQRQLGQGKPNLTSLGHRTVHVSAHTSGHTRSAHRAAHRNDRLTAASAHSCSYIPGGDSVEKGDYPTVKETIVIYCKDNRIMF